MDDNRSRLVLKDAVFSLYSLPTAHLSYMSALTRRLIDLAANLSDSSYRPDLPQVLQRAKAAGVIKFLLSGSSLPESQKAYEVCAQDADCYCTLGVHPCRANVRAI